MIAFDEKENCCGCTACAAVCPKQCISMRADNEGFAYPIVERERCIRCGLCERVCPIQNPIPETSFRQGGYVVQNRDRRVLRESTSGGAFTEIARYALKRGGVVFGAACDSTLRIIHQAVSREEDLSRFRNSKYVQSWLGNAFSEAKAYLEAGQWVCFSGTPCQIEGLHSFLRNDYPNLITVDVVCRAVPSPFIFQKYLNYLEAALSGPVEQIRFRDKHYGYKFSTMNVVTEKNKGKYHKGMESDPWLRAFFSNICDRPSCYQCRFKKRYRVSDFTIWDCFQPGEFSKALDNNLGASRVLIHTEKGRQIFAEIASHFDYVNPGADAISAGCRGMLYSVPRHLQRDLFFHDAAVMDGKALFEKWFPSTWRVKIERLARMACLRLGIYSFVRRIYGKVYRKQYR